MQRDVREVMPGLRPEKRQHERFDSKGAPNYRSVYRARAGLGILGRLLWRGILPGGLRRIRSFVKTLPLRRPSAMATVMSEWIVALSMRDFAQRRLASHVRTGESRYPDSFHHSDSHSTMGREDGKARSRVIPVHRWSKDRSTAAN